jgi:hypothetical protein
MLLENQSDLPALLNLAKALGLNSMVWSTDRDTKKPLITVAAWPHVASGETEMEALINLLDEINQAK